jgi:hypothetical protein
VKGGGHIALSRIAAGLPPNHRAVSGSTAHNALDLKI